MASSRTLSASLREQSGKGAARKLRAVGRIPAILYGHGDETRSLSLDAHEVNLLIAAISVDNTIISLEIDGAGTQDVLIRDVQTHPYRPEVLHLDFIQIHAGEPIRLQVPVRLTGAAPGVVNSGGVLDHVLYDLEIECLPRDIPEVAEVDISHLEIGDSVRVSDVSLPRVTILNDADLPIASVTQPTKRADEAETPDADATAEPELVRTREAEGDAGAGDGE